MRRRQLAVGAALLVLALVALGSAAVLRDRAERGWLTALDRLEASLGAGAEVSYGALDVALFSRGGKVRELSISAPGHPDPFTLTVAELSAGGLAQEGAAGLRLRSGSARNLELVTPRGRWRIDRLALKRLVVHDSPLGGLGDWPRRLAFESGQIEQLSFDRTAALPEVAGSEAPMTGPAGEAESLPAPAPRRATGPIGSLARAELGRLADGRLARLRFDRLLLEAAAARRLEVARGGAEGLDLARLATAAAGGGLPADLFLEHARLEGGSLREQGSEAGFASLVFEQSPEGDALRSRLAVDGLTTNASDPRLGGYWAPIETAGHGRGFRLQAVLTTEPGSGRFEIRPLLLELPTAASLELALELSDLDLETLAEDPLAFAETGLRSRLASARLVLVDEGGLDAILAGPAGDQGMTARQLRQVAAFQVAEALRQGQVPRAVGVAVQEFLADPGRLEIRVEPADPVPLVVLAMLGLAPDQAAEQLGITASSEPGVSVEAVEPGAPAEEAPD
ncbi:MAG: hypothetical protein WD341_12645 [Tistlia sp.]|uniref:hypothetical protein n=1 Tax=Tistlia sp. TaxID=3057121 RepID=UPI0034A3F959